MVFRDLGPDDRSLRLVPWKRDHLLDVICSQGAGPCRFVVGWLALMVGLVLVNLVQGTLVLPEGAAVRGADLSHHFPLLRDPVTLVVLTLLTVNFSMLYRQWAALGDLIPELEQSGVLTVVDRPSFAREVACANEKWESACRSNVTLIVAVVLALALQGAESAFGIFWSLAPERGSSAAVSAWSHEAYAHWWASLPDHWLGFTAYLVAASFVMYYVIAQNHVGVRVCLVFWRQRNNMELSFNMRKVDGWHGWRPLRRVMWTVYVSVLINAVALVWMIHMIAPPLTSGAPAALMWAVPWLFLLVVLGPCYIAFPYYLVAPRLRRRRRQLEEPLVRELEALGPYAPGDPVDLLEKRDRLRKHIESFRELPVFPVRFKWVVLLYALLTTASAINTALSLSSRLIG